MFPSSAQNPHKGSATHSSQRFRCFTKHTSSGVFAAPPRRSCCECCKCCCCEDADEEEDEEENEDEDDRERSTPSAGSPARAAAVTAMARDKDPRRDGIFVCVWEGGWMGGGGGGVVEVAQENKKAAVVEQDPFEGAFRNEECPVLSFLKKAREARARSLVSSRRTVTYPGRVVLPYPDPVPKPKPPADLS